MAASSSQGLNPDPELWTLPDLLDRGWKIVEEVEGSSEPLGSSSVQQRVRRGISLLEEASRMAAQLQLFSRNEELEEVCTSDLKFLLLPALLGALHTKLTGRDRRLEALKTARVYFLDFLRRCSDYSILPNPPLNQGGGPGLEARGPDQSVPAGPSDLAAMATKRQSKIERYRQRKELEAKLSDIRRVVESGQADDEVSRDFYLLNVRRWVTVCLEEVESIDQEVEILRNMDVLKQGPSKHPARPPMKPFILTRDALQAQVFGAGYPSLPTMTVDDWYEQHTKHGVLPDQGLPRRVAVDDVADAEEKDEEDDEEGALQKARNWDDWKDSHRRGYGNRQNMG